MNEINRGSNENSIQNEGAEDEKKAEKMAEFRSKLRDIYAHLSQIEASSSEEALVDYGIAEDEISDTTKEVILR